MRELTEMGTWDDGNGRPLAPLVRARLTPETSDERRYRTLREDGSNTWSDDDALFVARRNAEIGDTLTSSQRKRIDAAGGAL